MLGTYDYLAGLAQIHTRDSLDDRRALFRQGLASLAAATLDQQPTPLEGLATDQLLLGVSSALSAKFFDDLSFLSRPVGAAALFELAGALPTSPAKRELGRRVLVELHEGDAATFVTLATALALASPKALGGAPIRARVALSLRLPLAVGAHVDGLALALLSRPELERNWLTAHSMGALPARRLASVLLERAAREAVNRAKEGDDSGVRVLERPAVRAAWSRLITDRESLVWRHVAAARGLLAQVAPMRAAEIERDVSPRLGPSEWRRAATSLAATLSHEPQAAMARCQKFLGSEILSKDPGVAASMIFGLSRVVEQEPEAADELLAQLVPVGGVEGIEALVDLRDEHHGNPIGAQAAFMAIQSLKSTEATQDDGALALTAALIDDLDMYAVKPASLRTHLRAALDAFALGKDLSGPTDGALAIANSAMDLLESLGDESPEDRQRTFMVLREMDTGLLASSALTDLLVVRSRGERGPSPLLSILWRLGSWLLVREHAPVTNPWIPHLTLRFRQLRTFLHLVDSEFVTDGAPTPEARGRRIHTFKLLALRAQSDVPSGLRRLLCATLARAADALAREQVCDLSDVFVATIWSIQGATDLRAMSEACMVPEFKDVFAAAAEVPRTLAERGAGPLDEALLVDNLRDVAEALPAGSSSRLEGLRRAILGITRILEGLNDATSLTELRKGEESPPLDRLAGAIAYAARLCAGAMRRTGLREDFFPSTSTRALRRLEAWIDRAVRERDAGVETAAAAAIEAVRQDLPPLLAEVVGRVLLRIGRLPREPIPTGEITRVTRKRRQLHLPAWLPPSHLLGGFYVVRPIGSGNGGSVFVAKRAEERHDEDAETFALKVPAYTGAAAHTLSEDEFMQLFQDEAGALLTLPRHPNLATFVTFDAGARPKPILVMELVTGPNLERLVDRRELTMRLVLDLLDGIGGGLLAMHNKGIGHLDVKPANIILREPGRHSSPRRFSRDERRVPVLVDFGLAGRKVRPGCGSPYYGAPEIWDLATYGERAQPPATDVYAFSCMAFELLSGNPLFAEENVPAIVSAHLSHDGDPPGLAWLRRHKTYAPIGELLSLGLRRDPAHRIDMQDLREQLGILGLQLLADAPWPLSPSR